MFPAVLVVISFATRFAPKVADGQASLLLPSPHRPPPTARHELDLDVRALYRLSTVVCIEEKEDAHRMAGEVLPLG